MAFAVAPGFPRESKTGKSESGQTVFVFVVDFFTFVVVADTNTAAIRAGAVTGMLLSLKNMDLAVSVCRGGYTPFGARVNIGWYG
ncbi:MAG: hypothetical protein JJ891_02155 [Rhizobiaceae bacterium]|jgi:hypothetical protein|nr:hypothetical protein [Rhizobiaceae bacterium]